MTSVASRWLGLERRRGPSTSDSARVVKALLDGAQEAEARFKHLQGLPQFQLEYETIEESIDKTAGFVMVSSLTRIRLASKNATAVLGWSLEELRARDWSELIHPQDLKRSMEAAANMSAGEKLPPFVNRWLRKNGGWQTLSWTATPYVDGLCFAIAIPAPCAECPIPE